MTAASTHGVIEVAGRHGLLHRNDIGRIGLDDNFHALTQRGKLITNISHSTERLELKEILVTELLRVIALHPLLVHVQKGEVVASRLDEVAMCFIRMHSLVFWSIKDRAGLLQHGNDREDLFRQHHVWTCGHSSPHVYSGTPQSR